MFAATNSDKKTEINPKENITKNNEAPEWLIAEHEYGDKYPYNEYYLQLFCYKSAVWLESTEGNIYALNGIAKSSDLKKSSKYKGGTETILKKGMLDLFTPTEALNRCYTLNDGEYQARIK